MKFQTMENRGTYLIKSFKESQTKEDTRGGLILGESNKGRFQRWIKYRLVRQRKIPMVDQFWESPTKEDTRDRVILGDSRQRNIPGISKFQKILDHGWQVPGMKYYSEITIKLQITEDTRNKFQATEQNHSKRLRIVKNTRNRIILADSRQWKIPGKA